MERPCFDMLMKIKVLLENAKARDSDADPTVQNTRMRARYAKYHAISSIEARERAILRFYGASVGVVPRMLTCNRLLYESIPAVIMVDD